MTDRAEQRLNDFIEAVNSAIAEITELSYIEGRRPIAFIGGIVTEEGERKLFHHGYIPPGIASVLITGITEFSASESFKRSFFEGADKDATFTSQLLSIMDENAEFIEQKEAEEGGE